MTYECVCDWDSPAWSRAETRKARKAWTCDECTAPILIGETYRYDTGMSDGWIYENRTCSACRELCDWAKISVPCFCYLLSNLHEAVREMVSEVRQEVPGFLMEWGRRMVAIKRARAGKVAS